MTQLNVILVKVGPFSFATEDIKLGYKVLCYRIKTVFHFEV
jgi:hypothetical protein